MSEQLIKSILENKIIAIVRGANVEQAVKSAKAVYQGGIRFIEVTFNQKSPDTFQDTVNAIKHQYSDQQDCNCLFHQHTLNSVCCSRLPIPVRTIRCPLPRLRPQLQGGRTMHPAPRRANVSPRQGC